MDVMMNDLRVSWNQQWYKLDSHTGIDISIGIDFSDSVRAFGVGMPIRKPLQVDGFVGSVAQGGSCNCDEITFVPHCHGTHTETVAHILKDTDEFTPSGFSLVYLSQLITVNSQREAITLDMLEQANVRPGLDALIIRTLPNDPAKKHMHYKDQAAYICPKAMAWLVDQGVNHLLIDTPSVDPIHDGGALSAHHAFWKHELEHKRDWVANQSVTRTITELIYVPNEVKDNMYALALNVGNYSLDAMPSRPTIFQIHPVKENQ